MQKLYTGLTRKPKLIVALFIVAFLVCFVCDSLVAVNYEITDYLPDNTKSTISLDLMTEEFDGGIPNARVMITDVTVPEALEYKEQLKQVAGVNASLQSMGFNRLVDLLNQAINIHGDFLL